MHVISYLTKWLYFLEIYNSGSTFLKCFCNINNYNYRKSKQTLCLYTVESNQHGTDYTYHLLNRDYFSRTLTHFMQLIHFITFFNMSFNLIKSLRMRSIGFYFRFFRNLSVLLCVSFMHLKRTFLINKGAICII